jgi:hypothetical protein
MDSFLSVSNNPTASPLLETSTIAFIDTNNSDISNDYNSTSSSSLSTTTSVDLLDPVLQCLCWFSMACIILYCIKSKVVPPESMRRGHVIRARAHANRQRAQQKPANESQTPCERAHLVQQSLYTKVSTYHRIIYG